MPKRGGREIHIRVSLGVWFCDYSGWWVVWLLDSTLGGGFGVVGGRVDIHIRVCMSNSCEPKNDSSSPPQFAQRAGRRSQFVLADTFG